MLGALNIEHRYSTPYHPETNGQVERTNRTLGAIIKKLASDNPKGWDKELKKAVFALNSSINRSTGKAPNDIIFTYRPRAPHHNALGESVVIEEVGRDHEAEFEAIHDRLEVGKEKVFQKRKQNEAPMVFNKGTFVLSKNHGTDHLTGKKLKKSYNEILVVVEDKGETLKLMGTNYRIRVVNKREVKATRAGITEALEKLKEKVLSPEFEAAGDSDDVTAMLLRLPDSAPNFGSQRSNGQQNQVENPCNYPVEDLFGGPSTSKSARRLCISERESDGVLNSSSIRLQHCIKLIKLYLLFVKFVYSVELVRTRVRRKSSNAALNFMSMISWILSLNRRGSVYLGLRTSSSRLSTRAPNFRVLRRWSGDL